MAVVGLCDQAATDIQGALHGHRIREATSAARNDAETRAAVLVQAAARGIATRQKVAVQQYGLRSAAAKAITAALNGDVERRISALYRAGVEAHAESTLQAAVVSVWTRKLAHQEGVRAQEEAAQLIAAGVRARHARQEVQYMLYQEAKETASVQTQAMVRRKMAARRVAALEMTAQGKKAAAHVLTGVVRGVQTRRTIHNQGVQDWDEAATTVQGSIRGKENRRIVGELAAHGELRATAILQGFSRGKHSRQHIAQAQCALEEDSASKVQGALATLEARRRFKAMEDSATVLQGGVRGVISRTQRAERRNERQAASLRIQAAIAGARERIRVRQRKQKLWDSTVVVQSRLQGLKSRHEVHFRHQEAAARVLQGVVTGVQTRGEVPARFEDEEAAAILLQVAMKGKAVRKILGVYSAASLRLQAGLRGWTVRQTVMQQVILDQAVTDAAVVLQGGVIGHRTRHAVIVLAEATERGAVKMQAGVRGTSERRAVKQQMALEQGKAARLLQGAMRVTGIRSRMNEWRALLDEEASEMLTATARAANTRAEVHKKLQDTEQLAVRQLQAGVRGKRSRLFVANVKARVRAPFVLQAGLRGVLARTHTHRLRKTAIWRVENAQRERAALSEAEVDKMYAAAEELGGAVQKVQGAVRGSAIRQYGSVHPWTDMHEQATHELVESYGLEPGAWECFAMDTDDEDDEQRPGPWVLTTVGDVIRLQPRKVCSSYEKQAVEPTEQAVGSMTKGVTSPFDAAMGSVQEEVDRVCTEVGRMCEEAEDAPALDTGPNEVDEKVEERKEKLYGGEGSISPVTTPLSSPRGEASASAGERVLQRIDKKLQAIVIEAAKNPSDVNLAAKKSSLEAQRAQFIANLAAEGVALPQTPTPASPPPPRKQAVAPVVPSLNPAMLTVSITQRDDSSPSHNTPTDAPSSPDPAQRVLARLDWQLGEWHRQAQADPLAAPIHLAKRAELLEQRGKFVRFMHGAHTTRPDPSPVGRETQAESARVRSASAGLSYEIYMSSCIAA